MSLKDDFEELVSKIIKLMKKSLNKNSDRKDIKNFQNEFSDYLFTISRLFDLYDDEIKEFYRQNNPFDNKTKEEDIEDFFYIVQDAFLARSYDIIDEWAIRYPLQNPDVLVEDLSYYVENFRADLDDWETVSTEEGWPSGTKKYWQYLAENLSRLAEK